MNFIRELAEDRFTRDIYDEPSLTYQECKERLYLTLLMIEMLRKQGSGAILVEYVQDTIAHCDFAKFRAGATSLHNLIYYVNGNETSLQKLKDPGEAIAMRERTTLPLSMVTSYLRDVSTGKLPHRPETVLLKVETALGITNSSYKNLRRNVTSYESLSSADRDQLIENMCIVVADKTDLAKRLL